MTVAVICLFLNTKMTVSQFAIFLLAAVAFDVYLVSLFIG